MDGQFYPFQPFQFRNGLLTPVIGARSDIVIIADDGDISSLGNATTHDFGSQTSTGPYTVLFISWFHGLSNTRTISSAAWNGDSITILSQLTLGTGAVTVGAGIGIIGGGARSGTLTVTMSGVMNEMAITKLSIDNVITVGNAATALTASGTDPTVAQGTPGAGGIRLISGVSTADTTAVTPTGVTELSDFDVEDHRHFAGYVLGDSGTSIGMDAGGTEQVIAGASVR